jgi:hypothetical protein
MDRPRSVKAMPGAAPESAARKKAGARSKAGTRYLNRHLRLADQPQPPPEELLDEPLEPPLDEPLDDAVAEEAPTWPPDGLISHHLAPN